MIEVEGLVHVYPDGMRAIDGLDLSIAAGERIAIVGQNGSGKSTLVRHFNGLLRPTSGRVLVDGSDAGGRRVADLARTVGLAFQDPDRQIFSGTVRSEVAFGPRNVGLRGAELEAAVEGARTAGGGGGGAAAKPDDRGFGTRSERRASRAKVGEQPGKPEG